MTADFRHFIRLFSYFLTLKIFRILPSSLKSQVYNMRIVLTGATGAAGAEVLRVALANPRVDHVTVLSRRPLAGFGNTPPAKLETILHNDFTSYPSDLISRVASSDGCVWALGMSTSGKTEADYTRVTHDYAVAFLDAVATARSKPGNEEDRAPFRFVYVSGDGADKTEKSRLLFARIKGRTETSLNAIASNNPEAAISTIHLRPAYFFPTDPAERSQRSTTGRFMDNILTPLLSFAAPKVIVPIRDLALVALELATKGLGAEHINKQTDADIMSNAEIKEMAECLKGEWSEL